VKVGCSLPQLGLQANRQNLVSVAQRAEELGYDSVWVLERLLWPIEPKDPYPAAPDGKLPDTYQIVLDPLETLTFVAALTSKVRLGTSVLVLPFHTPIELARRIATLDVLSGGRVEVGVGIGWSRDEFEAAGAPFERRGARADEFLQAMVALWTENPVSFNGEFYRIPESMIGPKPLQRPHPPVYVGGSGKFALERAVKHGDGWNPSGIPSIEWLGNEIKQLQGLAAAAGRPAIDVVLRGIGLVLDQSGAPNRMPTMGTLGEIREDVQRLRDVGVTEIIYSPPEIGWFNSPGIEAGLARLEQLIEISR
jgi:probable F420-dependent oxidoreductase